MAHILFCHKIRSLKWFAISSLLHHIFIKIIYIIFLFLKLEDQLVQNSNCQSSSSSSTLTKMPSLKVSWNPLYFWFYIYILIIVIFFFRCWTHFRAFSPPWIKRQTTRRTRQIFPPRNFLLHTFLLYFLLSLKKLFSHIVNHFREYMTLE